MYSICFFFSKKKMFNIIFDRGNYKLMVLVVVWTFSKNNGHSHITNIAGNAKLSWATNAIMQVELLPVGLPYLSLKALHY